jgi:ribonucleoside-diphosphate reductase alpha chain
MSRNGKRNDETTGAEERGAGSALRATSGDGAVVTDDRVVGEVGIDLGSPPSILSGRLKREDLPGVFETNISEEVYQQNYQYGDDRHIADTWQRVGAYLAGVEDETAYWAGRFYQLLSGWGLDTGPFPFSPGGRILANAGTGLDKATLINCYVSGFQGRDQDSMTEIQNELSRQARILASEGGYGFCCHVMRPRGARIGGVGAMTPGAVQMLDMWNEQAATIVAGSGMKSDRKDVKDKIRKGAQMVTMGVWHPDVLEFIEAKQQAGRLHKFNMSVLVSDEFMEAVRSDSEWALRFPDFEGEPQFYQEHWDGNLQAYEEKGGAVRVWTDPETGEKAVYRAREIWDKIMESTYNRNEPGVLFVDAMNRENNLQYCEHINATNPCGEQILPIGGVCLLGNFNLTQFVDMHDQQFRYDLLDELIPVAVRMLDNVNDLTYVPLKEQEENLQNKRRIGLGHYGDGSALMMMGVRYGSDEGARRMREFQEHFANRAYQASALLAEEKGPFPLFDKDEYMERPVIQRLSEKTRAMIAEHGLRNSHLLSIQPTGNTSTLANTPSSGIEPVFMHSYIRTAEQPSLPEGVTAPANPPNFFSDEEEVDAEGTLWVAESQGDETVLRCAEEGLENWTIHPTRGVCKDEVVEDYAVRRLKERGEWDPDADWAITTSDLTVDEHLKQMEAIAPFVDSSMSKTVNVPADYPFDEFKDLYRKAHETGVIKGITTYRAGTMSAVLSSTDEEEDGGIPVSEAPDRPDSLECAVHHVNYRGDKWKIVVGFLEEDPYEVFAFMRNGHDLTDSDGELVSTGRVEKVESGQYQLVSQSGEVVVDDVTAYSPSDEVRIETRLASGALRHGMPVDFLVRQLEKAEGSVVSFGQAMAKALKAHVSEYKLTCDSCGSDNVRHVEGCMTCADCGHSRCS